MKLPVIPLIWHHQNNEVLFDKKKLAEPNKRKPKPAYATGEEVELFSQ
jgi:hypothetical protein